METRVARSPRPLSMLIGPPQQSLPGYPLINQDRIIVIVKFLKTFQTENWITKLIIDVVTPQRQDPSEAYSDNARENLTEPWIPDQSRPDLHY